MALSLCGASGFQNTGAIDCDLTRGNPLMILAGSATFSASDYTDQATMDAKIIEKLKLPSTNSQKLFPFPVIQGTADQTEAAKYGTLGYGLRFKLVRSKPSYEFDVVAGSNLEKKLMSYDGKNVPLLIYDDKGQFNGKINGTIYSGAVWQVGVEPHAYGDANNAKATKITISLVDSRDFVENNKIHVSALSTGSLAGLKDVTMRALSNASNVWKIKLEIHTDLLATATGGGNLDIYDDYGALIAALTFTAFTGANFATSLTVTSVAVDAALKALTVTFDSTAYTALATGTKIKLVAPIPSVLDAANVTGIEIASLIITKQ